jgi:hypothetical protein
MREPKAHATVYCRVKAFWTRLCASETTGTLLACCMIPARAAAVLFHLDVDSFYLTRLAVTNEIRYNADCRQQRRARCVLPVDCNWMLRWPWLVREPSFMTNKLNPLFN